MWYAYQWNAMKSWRLKIEVSLFHETGEPSSHTYVYQRLLFNISSITFQVPMRYIFHIRACVNMTDKKACPVRKLLLHMYPCMLFARKSIIIRYVPWDINDRTVHVACSTHVLIRPCETYNQHIKWSYKAWKASRGESDLPACRNNSFNGFDAINGPIQLLPYTNRLRAGVAELNESRLRRELRPAVTSQHLSSELRSFCLHFSANIPPISCNAWAVLLRAGSTLNSKICWTKGISYVLTRDSDYNFILIFQISFCMHATLQSFTMFLPH